MKVLHIVRQFGPVGGMERYVWELAQAQEELGHDVSVLCEVCHKKAGMKVYELGQGLRKPRWLSALLFSWKVTAWIKSNPQSDRVIHSHETTATHHLTTFHGPPFARIRQGPWWKRLSLRVHANLWLEKRELCGVQVQYVVPNSKLIADELLAAYPNTSKHLALPIIPGVSVGETRPNRQISPTGGVIGFIGKEWKRKGLDRVVSIVEELYKTRPDCELWVVGPEPKEVSHLFNRWKGGYKLLGCANARDIIPQLDLLIHPARREPFGMVITEALASQVPVVVSSQCGAASEVGNNQGKVLDGSNIEPWAEACDELLSRKVNPPPYQRSWQDVAKAYIDIYRSIQLS